MESVPIINEWIQAGVVGLCMSLIASLVYVVRLFTNSLMTIAVAIREFTGVIAKHNERLERINCRYQNGNVKFGGKQQG